ncbi:hypothetical protein C8R45DRAFT_1114211 [Mycena sanguinolenta]|nr:hypothetical protein C8R45DRAFT_1114211 [Mycena sanguinolenta]
MARLDSVDCVELVSRYLIFMYCVLPCDELCQFAIQIHISTRTRRAQRRLITPSFSDAAGATSFDFNKIFTPFEFSNFGFDANLPVAPAPIQGTTSSIAGSPFPADFDFSWTQGAQFPATLSPPAPSLPINNYDNYLLLLPPPPPESPERTEEAFPVASSSNSIPPRSRGCREPEVDVRNILPATSARSRVPTARKRGAEAADDEASRSKRMRKVWSTAIILYPADLLQ